MKIHPSLTLYCQLNTPELLEIFKSRTAEIPESFSLSDSSADFRELVFAVILRICELSMLDIAPGDLFDLPTQSFLQTLVFILANLNEYDKTNRKEETKTLTNDAQTETQIPEEENLVNKYDELRKQYDSLQNQLEQITSLFKHLSGNGEDLTITLSEVVKSLSETFPFSDSNQENSHNFLLSLIELITQMMAILNEKNSLIEHLQGRVNYLNRQLFGTKSEQKPFTEEDDEASDNKEEEPEQSEETDTDTEIPTDEEIEEDEKEAEAYEEKWKKNKKEHEKKKRGAKKGHKGYGRKIPNGLPIDEITIKIPEEQMYCPRCGAHYQLINSYEESHDIEQFFTVAHRILKREKARKTCDCEDVSPIITAPVYPKIVPQSIYSTETWIQFLTEKYFLQVPLNRQMRRAIMFGHQPCAGTVAGGLRRFVTILRPIYKRLMEESRKAEHWHVDETGWKMFVYVDDKENYRWWL